MNVRTLTLWIPLIPAALGLGSPCFAQDQPAASPTPQELAKRYPKDRDYAKEWHTHTKAKNPAGPAIIDPIDDRWYLMTLVGAQASATLDYGIEHSRKLRSWSRERHPGDEVLEVRLDLCQALMGRYDVTPVLDEVREFIARYKETSLPARYTFLRTPGPVLIPMPTTQPMMFAPMAWMSTCRAAARLNELRALVALRDVDTEEFVESFKDSMTIAELVEHDASDTSMMLAHAIRSLACQTVRHAVVRGTLTLGMRSEIQKLLKKPDEAVWKHGMNGVRLILLDVVHFAFENEEWFRKVMVKTEDDEVMFMILKQQDVTREETLARVDDVLEVLLRAGTADPTRARSCIEEAYEKIAQLDDFRGEGKLFPTYRIFRPNFKRLLRAELRARTNSEGLRTMLAIESFREEQGKLPETLIELVPKHLDSIPKDWYTHAVQELRYKRIDPADDALGRSYLLYSTGLDGVDDTGNEHDDDFDRGASAENGRGFDYIINSTPQWPRAKPNF
jgi:hypothetical protein